MLSIRRLMGPLVGPLTGKRNAARTVMGLTLIFLVIEFLDELVGGVLGAAWPFIRQDLHLSYGQVGLVLTLPNLIGCLVEPILGIWADLGRRRQLIVGSGFGFAIALVLVAVSQSLTGLLLGFIVMVPASGGFAELSQATLMDLEPTRHEQNMARWTFAGSVGNVAGPLLLAGAIALNQSWRGAFIILAMLIGFMAVLLWRSPISLSHRSSESQSHQGFRQGIGRAIVALKRPAVVRWLTLLQFSDLMLDVLYGFIALYFVDVVGATAVQAGGAISVWLGFGLLGDFLLMPLLERMSGLTYLKISAGLVLLLYPALLMVPGLTPKYGLLACLGFLNAGWYSILKGQVYTAMPGQTGAVITLTSLFGLVGSLAPLGLGFVALHLGLDRALWILMAAPIALLVGLFYQPDK